MNEKETKECESITDTLPDHLTRKQAAKLCNVGGSQFYRYDHEFNLIKSDHNGLYNVYDVMQLKHMIDAESECYTFTELYDTLYRITAIECTCSTFINGVKEVMNAYNIPTVKRQIGGTGPLLTPDTVALLLDTMTSIYRRWKYEPDGMKQIHRALNGYI